VNCPHCEATKLVATGPDDYTCPRCGRTFTTRLTPVVEPPDPAVVTIAAIRGYANTYLRLALQAARSLLEIQLQTPVPLDDEGRYIRKVRTYVHSLGKYIALWLPKIMAGVPVPSVQVTCFRDARHLLLRAADDLIDALYQPPSRFVNEDTQMAEAEKAVKNLWRTSMAVRYFLINEFGEREGNDL